MRRVGVIMSILLFGGIQVGLAQATGQENMLMLEYDPAAPAAPLFAGPVEQAHYVGKLNLPMLPQEEDTFATYAYTYRDMVIFSYADSNECRLVNSSGDVVWVDTIMRDGYAVPENLSAGVYQVLGSKEFSLISGDPWAVGLGAWSAVDENSTPMSTKFLSIGPGAGVVLPYDFEQVFIVFAYHDNTHVIIKNIDVDTLIWEGDLDSAEYYYYRHSNMVLHNFPYSVEATRPVSTMTGGGLGFYPTAYNGTFTGRDFMTYVVFVRETDGRIVSQDLQIVPWEDETWVTITDLDNPADTVWRRFLKNRGEIKGLRVPLPNNEGRALYIHADKDISVPQTPWTSYSPTQVIGFFLVRGVDRDGLGIGREFYLPMEGSVAWGITVISRLHVFAFEDNTQVKVSRMPREGGTEGTLWEGTLNRGEFYRYTCPIGDASAWGIYHVTASDGVATLADCYEKNGATFLPLWFAIHPDVAAYPNQFKETECLVPTSQSNAGAYEVNVENNGNIWDVINIFTYNSLDPDFVTELSDELGRPLPDVDGDGNPDTDTLPKRGSALVLADVTPAEMLLFGTTDTCFFSIVSMRDTTRLDTAVLVTRIREVQILTDPDTFVTEYPRNTKVIPVAAYSTSLYREDTVNLTYHSTQDSLTWPVSFTDTLGVPLQDTDANDTLDVPGVPTDSVAVPFQVRVRVPDSALAGDRDTIYLVATSGNYPYGSIYPETIDTTVFIVEVEAVAGLLIVPDTLDSVPSGQTIRYPMEVFNYGNGPDVPDITLDTGLVDWTHRLVDKDGINDLADTDGDGVPDLDTLSGLVGGVPGFETFYLDVTPPYWALPGLFDSTIVYARSSISDTVYHSAIVVTRTRNIVALDIEPDTFAIIGPGEEAVYLLRVTNLGSTYDIIDIGSYAAPDLGWSHTLTFKDGSPLLDEDNDGVPDLGSVDSSQTVLVRLVVRPHEEPDIVGPLDTTVTEHRVVWIRTYYTNDSTLVNDSVLITTRFEPVLDIHNYPNPFSGSTTFAFSIPRAGLVTLRIYNRAGEHIRTLIADEDYDVGGIFEAYWDGLTTSGQRPAPGVYIYTLDWRARRNDGSDGFSKAQRITKTALMQP